MSKYEAALRDLKSFQRATVDYVERRMFDEGQRRFLVADEVGLGKTLAARGIVARAIERLEEEGVRRIDVIYICSNAEIARQNIRKLNVLEDGAFERAERITLLPLYVHDLKPKRGRTKHNFVSFTPGTMPDPNRGHRTGWARERALIYHLLAEAWGFRSKKGPKRVLQGTSRTLGYFEWEIRKVGRMRIDPGLRRSFVAQLRRVERKEHLRARFDEYAATFSRREPRGAETRLLNDLIGKLRWHLARTCVEALEPDLIILDEFQRFRDLLDGTSDAAELAQAMFDHPDARVLLLSATPYRMFTTAGDDGDEDHHRDFSRTIRFLFGEDSRSNEIEALLERLRVEVLRLDGQPSVVAELRAELEKRLRLVMSRTERLAVADQRLGMLNATAGSTPTLDAGDLGGYVTFRRVLRDLDDRRASTLLEYWKSAPYLVNVMDGYQQKRLLEHAASLPGSGVALADRLQDSPGVLPFSRVRAYRTLPPANARMRQLIDETADPRVTQQLWLAPTMPYYESRAPFDRRATTKRLVFSSWAVVPKAIAALASYEAERQMIAPKGKPLEAYDASPRKLDRRLLDFKSASSTGRRTGMPVLGLLYPSFALAGLADPLELRREHAREGSALPSYDDAIRWASSRIKETLRGLKTTTHSDRVDERWYWAAPILLDVLDDSDAAIDWLDRYWLADLWSEGNGDPDATTRESSWSSHVSLATQLARGEIELGRMPDDLATVLAELALSGPGTATLRALSRVVALDYQDAELRDAAAAGAWSLRALLSHPESIAMIRSLVRRGPYWQRALRYCGVGGIQSVLDEYAHITHDIRGLGRMKPVEAAWELSRLLRVVAGLKTAAVVVDEVRNSDVPFAPFTFRARFAARYGESREVAGEERTRAESLRDSFNSPFWPFVLATTSVGQEGLDFHAYCHAVVHWNLPSNPVDLEQREGRVHRYKGYAVRKNVAAAHADDAFAGNGRDPWTSLFDKAVKASAGSSERDLVPFWVYNGDARIERHVPMLPLSRDEERYRRLQRSLGLYRMVLGQPRQEDLVELLAHRGDAAAGIAAELHVDLSPPASPRRRKSSAKQTPSAAG